MSLEADIIDTSKTNNESETVRAKEIGSLLENHFYDPQRIELFPTVRDTIASAKDPYTHLMPATGFGSIERITTKNLCDTGIDFQQEEVGFRVMRMRHDSGALFSDLHIGDLIIGVNGVRIQKNGMGMAHLHDFKESLTGRQGSVARLSTQKKHSEKTVMISLQSPRQYAEPIDTKRDDILAIRIGRFTAKTSDDILAILRRANPWKIRGVVLDVRGNRGGALQSAVQTSEIFLTPEAEVAHEVQREKLIPHTTKSAPEFGDIAVGLVSDRDSASASEILIAALRYHKGALTAGETTFGKGSVQRVFDLQGTTAQKLKITTSHWLTPDMRYIHDIGIEPDVVVKNVDVSSSDADDSLEAAIALLEATLPKRRPGKNSYRRAD